MKLTLATIVTATLAAALSSGAEAQVDGQPPVLSGVSCIGFSFCVVSGSFSRPGHPSIALLERWNGRAWQIIPDPRGYAGGFTCGGPSFCLAVATLSGRRVREVVWNGRTWQTLQQQPPTFGVICESPTFCVTYNGDPYEGRVVQWNGQGWQAMTDNSLMCGGPDCQFDSLSCDSASICFASGSIP